jgi:periplasmic protein TonB
MRAMTPAITAADRLSLTLFLAIIVHALVILGVGISWHQQRKQQSPPLIEIVLAARPSEKTPDNYDFLAQADQDGGGSSEKAERPQREARPLTEGVPEGDAARTTAPAESPPPPPDAQPRVAQTQKANSRVAPAQPSHSEQRPQPTAVDVVSASAELARSSEFLEERHSGVPRYPSKRRYDARTKAHAAAPYLYQLIAKVEQVGNLNYPEEARRRQLSGRVVMEITVRPDGHLFEARVLRGSGHTLLDQAATQVVRLSAPFPPVPAQALEGHDLLVLVRTLEFLDGARLQTNE